MRSVMVAAAMDWSALIATIIGTVIGAVGAIAGGYAGAVAIGRRDDANRMVEHKAAVRAVRQELSTNLEVLRSLSTTTTEMTPA